MRITGKPRNRGFTLVELLIVIAILLVLAALSFTVGSRMLAKSKATKTMENMRQMGPLFGIYAADHHMNLPPAKSPARQPDGTTADTRWHELFLAMLFPATDPADFKTKTWWDNNETFLRNPLFEETAQPRGWEPLNPGYGLNEMIPENLALASSGVVPPHEELDAISTPLAALGDPGRTPLVAPCDNYYFRYDPAELENFETGTLKDFLSEGKVPILFVDGHIEAISPNEYARRKLYLVPIVPVP